MLAEKYVARMAHNSLHLKKQIKGHDYVIGSRTKCSFLKGIVLVNVLVKGFCDIK